MPTTNKRTMPLYESGIAQCREAGVDLTPADYVRIYEAAVWCVEGDGREPALLEIPVSVGAVTLYPRTIGAALWWERFGKGWFGGKDTEDEVVALAWMLAHSKDAELFRRTDAKWKAVGHIVAWQIGLASSVTLAGLAYGIQRLFGQFDKTPEGAEFPCACEADWGEVISRLCATYHQPPEYFLWQIGERAAIEMLAKAPLPPGCERKVSDMSSARFADFIAIVNGIKNRKKASKWAL